MNVVLLAHGLGDAGDLPVELPVVLFLAAGLVLLAAWLVDQRVPDTADGGRPLPRLTAIADAPVLRGILRALAVAALAVVIVTAALGTPTAADNPAPRLVFVLFWGLLVPVSILFGPVWRVVNPFRTIAAGLARLSGDPGWRTAEPLPERIGVWPAAIQLAVFVWASFGAAERSGRVLLLVVGISAVQVLAANRYGPGWFRHGDPFEVVAEVFAGVSPLARGADGVLVLRRPRVSARELRVDAGVPLILSLVIAGHLTDFLLDTPLWHGWRAHQGRVGQLGVDSATLLLVGALTLLAVMAVVRRRRFLLPAIVPVAAGYALGHDTGVLLVDGQVAVLQLNDPLGQGSNLLGMAGRYVPAEPVPAMAAALVVVAALIVGHVAGVWIGRAQTERRFSGRAATAVQLPLRAFLVVSVVLSILLRLTVE